MAHIQFRPGITWENIPPTKVIPVIDLNIVTDRLAKLQAEWAQAAKLDNKELADMKANVLLILSDICDLLDLINEQRAIVFDLTPA